MVKGEVICKARLVARGFKEKGKDLNTDAPTCAPETLKVCVAKISEKGWKIHSLDIKTAYLQGDEIKGGRSVVETQKDSVWVERCCPSLVR